MPIYWNLQKRFLKQLKSNQKNPRVLKTHDADHLERSLSKFGVCEPIVINLDDTIIGGHQRVKTLKKMGVKEADVMVPDRMLTQEECDELLIRLNRNHGEWDWELLGNAWEPLDLVDYGFTMDELHIDVTEIEEDKKSKSMQIVISFADENDLEQVEMHVSSLISQYPTAKYKVKK